MPGKYRKTGSKLLHKKCARGCHDNVDRISQLPNDIIISILSLLSLREVISTSVLSSRWLDLWKHTNNLNFNNKLIKIKPRMQRPIDQCKYIQLVNSVLLSHKALWLSEFKISLYITKSAHGAVSKWLDYLFSREVESLELDFLCRSEVDKVALQDILSDIRLCPPQTDVILFKSLNRLRLKSCILSGEDIDMFLCNCPLLRLLSIHHTLLTSDVVVCGTTLKLQHLDIYCCTGDISIILSAPELSYLRVDTESDKLLLQNLSKLIRVDLTCRSQSVDDAKHFVSAVFCNTSRWKFLNLTLICPTEFLLTPIPLMPNLKTLGVTYSGSYGHCLLALTRLIWASPLLEEFKLEFRDLGHQTGYRVFLTNSGRDLHRHLKVFEFKGFCVEARQHVELVKYISNNCDALKIIIIRCRPLSFEYAAILKDSKQTAQAVAYRDRVERLLRCKDAATQPSLDIVYFGGNDASKSHPSGLSSHVPLPEYVENMKKITLHLKVCAIAQSLDEKLRIIFLTCPPVDEAAVLQHFGNMSDQQERTYEACGIYADALVDLCKEMDIQVINLWTAMQHREDWGGAYLR